MNRYDPDLDDDLDPEGPSAEDLERFSADDRLCPACGSSVYDEASVCPSCGEVLTEAASAAPKVAIIAAAAVVVAILLVSVF